MGAQLRHCRDEYSWQTGAGNGLFFLSIWAVHVWGGIITTGLSWSHSVDPLLGIGTPCHLLCS